MRTKKYPTDFYEELYEQQVRRVHSVIELLSWDENILDTIQGIVTSGTIGVDGTSNSRRSLNLSMSNIDRDGRKISEQLNYNKKVKVFIGLENMTRRFEEDDIIWFNMGTYILSEPSLSHGVDQLSFSVSAYDKMAMLNGVLGGKLTAPVSFTQMVDEKVVSLTWREIFYNAATLIGGEDPSKVVVDSVPDYIKEYTQVKQVGGLKDKFIHVDADSSVEGERIIAKAWHPTIPEREINFSKGERLYKLRRFGPQDPRYSESETVEPYIKNTGESITDIFDDVTEQLSHTHEYYYTQEGDLIFQPIKTFINDRFNPELNPEYGYYSYELNMEYFQPNFSGLPFVYDLSDKKTVISYTNNPSWDNIKNDFVVVGGNGQSLEIAIDDKPTILDIRKWFIQLSADFNANSSEMKFIQRDGVKRECYNPLTNTVPFEYKPEYRGSKPIYVEVPLDKIPWQIAHGLKNYYIRNIYGGANHRALPRWGKECESMIFKWNLSLDGKVLKPNTGIYNPSLIGVGTPWLAGYPVSKLAGTEDKAEEYNTDNPIFTSKGDSSFWLYFLDLIDTSTSLGKYSISLIGKRSAPLTVEKASTIFRTNPKELAVITEQELAMLGGERILADLERVNQGYAIIKDISDQMFMPEGIRENKDRVPYANMIGDPLENEKMFYSLPIGDGTSMTIQIGGKFSGQLVPNNRVQGEVDGVLLITPGTYLDPRTNIKHEDMTNKEIVTPFTLENDETSVAFLAYIDAKGSRIPDSGPHKFFAVVKHINQQWFYGADNNGVVSWKPFSISKNRDILVAVLEQNVYKSDDFSSSSGSIDNLETLFNIRDSKMGGMFSVDGAVDCFSALRSLMHKHTSTAEVINIVSLPMYHLEPNTLIRVEDYYSDIHGIFMITSITLPLSHDGGSMNISAIRVNPRI